MRALIYDPYLDTLGGGERYCLTAAEHLLENDWQVDLPWPDSKIKHKLIKRFSLNIGNINIIDFDILSKNLLSKISFFKRYDLVFWVSDGSVPFLFGKKNLVLIQAPFIGVNKKRFLNNFKFNFINQVVCYSKFAKKFIDKEFGVNSMVLYPPVDVARFKPEKKENLILAVSRFEETMQAKRQNVLIEVFREMIDEGLKNWKLILIGGSLEEPKKNKFLKELKEMSQNYPVEFLVNTSFKTLQKYYGRAKVFWHAAGFGIDGVKEPWRMEHFGMTTVEAMAAGCVPVVFGGGGLPEIVRRGAGEKWKTKNELKRKTMRLITNEGILLKYQRKAALAAQKFSKNNFSQQFQEILNEKALKFVLRTR